MVDLSTIVGFVADHAALVGVALLAAGFLLALVGRALSALVLAVSLIAAAAVAMSEWQRGGSLLAVALVLGSGVVAAVLLASFVRRAVAAISFLVFLTAWFLLFDGWFGFSYVSSDQGSLAWLAVSVVTTAISARFARSRQIARGLLRGARVGAGSLAPGKLH